MKKILFVTKYFLFDEIGGGAQKSIELLVESLKSDYKVEVFTLKTKSSKKWIYKFNLNLIKKVKYFDLIYLNSFFSPLTIFFLLFKKNKIIISPKGELFSGALKNKSLKKKIWLYVFNLFFKGRFIFHASSYDEKKIINKIVSPKKILIAPDIINFKISNIKPSINKELKIIFISRLDFKKNLLFAINILSRVKRKIYFDIYGDIGDKRYFEKCIYKLKKFPRNVKWEYRGALKKNEVNRVFLMYDLFFFPTLGENFGYVILESLSNYCPLLLSKGTTIFDDLDKFSIGSNIDLNSSPKNWVNYIEIFKPKKAQDDFLNFKNYLFSKFDTNKIIQSNKKMIDEVLRQ